MPPMPPALPAQRRPTPALRLFARLRTSRSLPARVMRRVLLALRALPAFRPLRHLPIPLQVRMPLDRSLLRRLANPIGSRTPRRRYPRLLRTVLPCGIRAMPSSTSRQHRQGTGMHRRSPSIRRNLSLRLSSRRMPAPARFLRSSRITVTLSNPITNNPTLSRWSARKTMSLQGCWPSSWDRWASISSIWATTRLDSSCLPCPLWEGFSRSRWRCG